MNKPTDTAGAPSAEQHDARPQDDKKANDEDGALASIGKAITAPVTDAAEAEEPSDDKPPQAPGG